MYADLLPIGIAYPELMVDSAIITIEPGNFCFFQIPSATTRVFIVPGLIVGADYETQMCTVHRYQHLGRPKNNFIPMWAPIEGSMPYRGKQIARASKGSRTTSRLCGRFVPGYYPNNHVGCE